MLQTALRDDEPKSEPGTAPLDSEQAAALMTCMAQVDVHPRRGEFRGDTEVGKYACAWASGLGFLVSVLEWVQPTDVLTIYLHPLFDSTVAAGAARGAGADPGACVCRRPQVQRHVE